jgi:catechol 2,3-dioxygenase-like lactoylglutathione lyase family enzyme
MKVQGNRPAGGSAAVHSIDHVGLDVPDLTKASDFYETFGLLPRPEASGLGLYTKDHPHRWVAVRKGTAKRLRYLSFGAYAEDLDQLAAQMELAGAQPASPAFDDGPDGLWYAGFDWLPINIRIAEKSSPDMKSQFGADSAPAGVSGAISNSRAPAVHPRRLSHVAIFATDIDAAVEFYSTGAGLKLSDRSGPFVAFLHGTHGSDHHMLALVKSDHRGLHHLSWDVGSVQDIGLGMAQLARKGFNRGWGLGRHVLGANYFYYARDPWGSYCEYSADIDYIPKGCEWSSGDHPPEDSLFIWGPQPPPEFAENFEPSVSGVRSGT